VCSFTLWCRYIQQDKQAGPDGDIVLYRFAEQVRPCPLGNVAPVAHATFFGEPACSLKWHIVLTAAALCCRRLGQMRR
jgi:hypothetical protein